MFIVTYLTVLQNIKTKKFVFRPAQKRQILSNLNNFGFFTVHHLRSGNLSFFCSLKYIIIRVNFLHTCRFHHYLHPRFFRYFQNFKLSISKKFKKGATGSPSSKLTLSIAHPCAISQLHTRLYFSLCKSNGFRVDV
jgi:hypothetical protein